MLEGQGEAYKVKDDGLENFLDGDADSKVMRGREICKTYNGRHRNPEAA